MGESQSGERQKEPMTMKLRHEHGHDTEHTQRWHGSNAYISIAPRDDDM